MNPTCPFDESSFQRTYCAVRRPSVMSKANDRQPTCRIGPRQALDSSEGKQPKDVLLEATVGSLTCA